MTMKITRLSMYVGGRKMPILVNMLFRWLRALTITVTLENEETGEVINIAGPLNIEGGDELHIHWLDMEYTP